MGFLKKVVGLFWIAAGIGIVIAGTLAVPEGDAASLAVAVFGWAVSVPLFVMGYRWVRPPNPDAWRDEKPSAKQMAFADELGIDYPEGITKGELSDLISQVTGR